MGNHPHRLRPLICCVTSAFPTTQPDKTGGLLDPAFLSKPCPTGPQWGILTRSPGQPSLLRAP